MADHEAVSGPGEAPVGDERDRLGEALSDNRTRDMEHLAHSGPAVRPFVPDHDDVARADRPCFHGCERVLLRVEHARGTAVKGAVVAGELHDAPVRRQVAIQHRDPSTGFQRRLDRDDHGLPLGLDRRVGDLAERPSVDRPGVLVQQAGLLQLARHETDTAGVVHVVGVPAPPRFHVGDDRRSCRDALEVVDRELEPEVARDRDEVQHGVRRPAGRRDRGDSVLERLLRHEGSRCDVVADELDGQAPCLVGRLLLATMHRGDPVHPKG